mgnify:CR=1 FL=1
MCQFFQSHRENRNQAERAEKAERAERAERAASRAAIGSLAASAAYGLLRHKGVPLVGHGGAIVNVSSMGGEITFPLGAWYHASKHALEAYSDALRQELGDRVRASPAFCRPGRARWWMSRRRARHAVPARCT